MNEIIRKFNAVSNTIDEINQKTSIITENKITFFSKLSLQVNLKHPEFGFYTLISWFYVLFYEASCNGKNIKFINQKILSYNITV